MVSQPLGGARVQYPLPDPRMDVVRCSGYDHRPSYPLGDDARDLLKDPDPAPYRTGAIGESHRARRPAPGPSRAADLPKQRTAVSNHPSSTKMLETLPSK